MNVQGLNFIHQDINQLEPNKKYMLTNITGVIGTMITGIYDVSRYDRIDRISIRNIRRDGHPLYESLGDSIHTSIKFYSLIHTDKQAQMENRAINTILQLVLKDCHFKWY